MSTAAPCSSRPGARPVDTLALEQRGGGPDYATEAPEPPKWQAGLTFLELLPGALTQLKADFEADRQAGVEAWRAARQKSAADDQVGLDRITLRAVSSRSLR